MVDDVAIPMSFPATGDVEGRRVVITGVSRGLGRVVAHAFARGGARLVLVARDRDALCEVAAELPGTHAVVAGDVRDPDVSDEAAQTAVTDFGGLDVWIANAGICPSVDHPRDVDPEWWRWTIDVNVNGVFWGLRAASRAMAPGGAIIATGSVVGQRPAEGLSAYATSKAALVGLVRAAAVDLARDEITVNLVVPGWFDSPLAHKWTADPARGDRVPGHTPAGRLGNPEDLPGAYLFLASPAARFVTGATVAVDGGYLTM